MRASKLLLIFTLFSTAKAFAHQDFWMTKTFGNVKVRIKTGFKYEEINKVWIIGELAQNLCNDLNYKDTVLLDFTHAYTDYCSPDYFISYGDGSIIQNWPGGEKESFLKMNALVIKEVSRTFDASKSLKLLEYGIRHLESIKANQKIIVYEKNYCQWRIKTIALSISKRIALSQQSTVVDKTVKMKIFRTKEKNADQGLLTYYFENNIYHITNFSKEEIKYSLDLKNIYQFISFPSNEAIVFDTDTSFYYVRTNPTIFCSKRYVIIDTHEYYQPFGYKIKEPNTIALKFWFYGNNLGTIERDVFYKSDVDKLIQNN
jgi:hypothetical protein